MDFEPNRTSASDFLKGIPCSRSGIQITYWMPQAHATQEHRRLISLPAAPLYNNADIPHYNLHWQAVPSQPVMSLRRSFEGVYIRIAEL